MLQRADPSDIPILIKHRSALFQELYDKSGKPYSAQDLAMFNESYKQFLDQSLRAKRLSAWLFVSDDECFSSGAISILDWAPERSAARRIKGTNA